MFAQRPGVRIREALLAAALILTATGARFALDPFLGATVPYVTFFLAVAIIAWLTSTPIAATSVVVCWAIADFFFVEPRNAFVWQHASLPGVVAALAYFATAGTIVLAGRAMRAARRRDAESFERLRTTIASIGDAVIAADRDARVTMMNGVAEQLTGWTTADAVGRPLTEVFHIVNETTRSEVENPCHRALREGVVVGLANHTILIARDGAERPIDDSAAPIRCAQGEIVGCVLIFRDVGEQRRAARLVAESEARMSAMFRVALDCVITIDQRGEVVEFNPAAEQTFGFRREDALGKELASLIVPHAFRDAHRKGLNHYLATGEGPVLNQRLELSALRADGSEFPVELTVTRVPVEGSPLFTAYVRDITERRRSEQATARLAAIVESSEDAIVSKDLNGVITSWNRGAERVFGYTAQEAIGQPVTMLMPPDLAAEEPGILDRVRRGEKIEPYETVRRRKDGSLFDVSLSVSPIVDASGNVVGASKILRDITERKRAEEALRSSEEQYRTLFNSIDEGFCVIEFFDGPHGPLSDYVHVEANPAYTANAGIPNIVGQKVREMVPDEADAWVETYRNVLLTGEPIRFERELVATHRHLELAAFRIEPPSRRQVAVLFKDVTTRANAEREIRRAKEAAELANIAKDNFLATLSHELRTPLTPVLATLTMWENDPSAFPEEMREDLSMVRRNVDLEARLIDDLLDLTRIAKGKIALHLEALDVQKLTDHVVTMYRSEINAKKLRLNFQQRAHNCLVRGDSGRLQQALWNVLKNAVKFTPEGGSVDVTIRNDAAGNVQVVIADSGMGIGPEMLRRLFLPFEQEHLSSIQQYGGLGLGLAITRALLEAQNGSIEAQSAGAGQGATFILTLPCIAASELAAASAEVQAAAAAAATSTSEHLRPAGAAALGAGRRRAGARSFRVLLVEDHIDTARVMARLLRNNGHEVAVAHTLADAKSVLASRKFDVLVSDIGLPDGTGIELAEHLRERYGSEMPALALTGFGMEGDVARTRAAGFNDHLTKPVNFFKLEEAVQRVCRDCKGVVDASAAH